MLVTIKLNKLPLHIVAEYKQNLLEAFGDKSSIVVSEDMYDIPELTFDQTGIKDNSGLYPMKFEMGLNNKAIIGDQIFVRFPAILPVIITEIDDCEDGSNSRQERLLSYGICETIADFMLMAGEQLQASKRKFFVTFGYSKPGDHLPVRSGQLIRSNHTIPMGKDQSHCMYHVWELVASEDENLTPMQKSDLMLMELSGKAIDTENLMANFQ